MRSNIYNELRERYSNKHEIAVAVFVAVMLILGSLAYVSHEKLQALEAQDNMCYYSI